MDVRLTGRFLEMAPGDLSAFFNGKSVGVFQIPGKTPLEKLSLKTGNSSALAIGPSALRKVGGMSSGAAAPLLRVACMAVLSLRMVTGVQQGSAAVGSCCAFFR